jgi:hypothetical protein
MPRLDDCHLQIVRALEKEGWKVSNAFHIRTQKRVVYIDALAWRGTNGESQQILLAEIKCFPDTQAATTELYLAFGQYILYRAVLAEVNNPTPLYLAVPEHIYQTVFDSTTRRAVSDNRIKLLLVDLDTETITRWNES